MNKKLEDEYDAILRSLGWEVGPQESERDLNGRLAANQVHRDATAAFDALSTIWAQQTATVVIDPDKPCGGMDPQVCVSVPWWVIWELNWGWAEYKTPGGSRDLGKAFRIHGTRKGEHTAVSRHKTEMTSLKYALLIARRIKWEGMKREAAIADVIDKVGGASRGKLLKIWAEFGSLALTKLPDQAPESWLKRSRSL